MLETLRPSTHSVAAVVKDSYCVTPNTSLFCHGFEANVTNLAQCVRLLSDMIMFSSFGNMPPSRIFKHCQHAWKHDDKRTLVSVVLGLRQR
jgi:hypothetical protein